jgi:hypothetical protein
LRIIAPFVFLGFPSDPKTTVSSNEWGRFPYLADSQKQHRCQAQAFLEIRLYINDFILVFPNPVALERCTAMGGNLSTSPLPKTRSTHGVPGR